MPAADALRGSASASGDLASAPRYRQGGDVPAADAGAVASATKPVMVPLNVHLHPRIKLSEAQELATAIGCSIVWDGDRAELVRFRHVAAA